MGKKTRTRRTKWRRLSLGDASGPEEEDDETQQQQLNDQLEPTQLPSEQSDQQQTEQSNGGQLKQQQQQQQVTEETLVDSTSEVDGSSERGSTPESAIGNDMPGEQQTTAVTAAAAAAASATSSTPSSQQRQWNKTAQQPKQAPSGANYATSGRPAAAPPSFRRAPRYNSGQTGQNGAAASSSSVATASASAASGNGSYGRANSWNSYDSHHHHHHHHHSHHHHPSNGQLGKTHGIEKKIFNDEEYTKISTPRQEVLFKKGSIGAKKRATPAAPTTPTTPNGHAADSGSEHDSGNASTSPTSPAVLNGDADSFHYSGNDNGSTGDASSTAGDAAGADGALAAGYDAGAAPLVCFPMYDFYGAYSGMYPGGMLVQTYPGGPLVPAVPVPVPVQAVDWYGRGSGASASSSGSTPTGAANSPPGGAPEMGFYYALGYPATAAAGLHADVNGPAPLAEAGSNSRRNSIESCQASSAEASEGSPSESGSGPSSQGPASPHGELANGGSPEKPGQSGASSTVAAAAATVMDMAMMDRSKMPVAGFLYPYAPYALAPPLFAGY